MLYKDLHDLLTYHSCLCVQPLPGFRASLAHFSECYTSVIVRNDALSKVQNNRVAYNIFFTNSSWDINASTAFDIHFRWRETVDTIILYICYQKPLIRNWTLKLPKYQETLTSDIRWLRNLLSKSVYILFKSQPRMSAAGVPNLFLFTAQSYLSLRNSNIWSIFCENQQKLFVHN